MYIQPQRPDLPFDTAPAIPRDYSGSAFSKAPAPPIGEQPSVSSPVTELSESPPDAQQPTPEEQPVVDAASTPVSTDTACKARTPENGLLHRFPFLGSLLPPKRSGKHETGLPDWVIWGLLLLLLSEDGNDVLPFLLLLLLWD